MVEGEHLTCCGWPESVVPVSDCELVKRATMEERMKLLRDMANSEGRRAIYAQRMLALAQPAAQPVAQTFLEWRESLTRDQRYDFDSEGRGYKKDSGHMMRLAYEAGQQSMAAQPAPAAPEDAMREALLADARQVLGMVDTNHRVDAGERRKAWSGKFVVEEVRRVLAKIDAAIQSTAQEPKP
jgi:hypothetical protein